MPERRIAHAEEDVASTLLLAMDMGLIIRRDHPTPTPEPDIITAKDAHEQKSGVFTLYKPEWIFGDVQYHKIESGYNEGKYFQSSRINIAEISIFFLGERLDSNSLRLGAGGIAYDKTWLRVCDNSVRESPEELRELYKYIIRCVDNKRRFKGGNQSYIVLEFAWKKFQAGLALPPYDYLL